MRIAAATVIAAAALGVLSGCASTAQTNGSGSGPISGTSTSAGTGHGSASTSGGTSTAPSASASASASSAQGSIEKAAAATCPRDLTITGRNMPNAKSVPAGLPVSWVLRCRRVSVDGHPTTLIAERSTGSAVALVNALQLPSAMRAKIVCPMFVVQLPYFALVQPDGQVFVPKVPLNNCGQPQNAVVSALNALTFTEISRTPLK